VANRRTKKVARITLDAFLEAVLDAAGFEDDVLIALEVNARDLHAWLEKNPHVKGLARDALEERDVDTSGYRLGWLRETDAQLERDVDANWALYRQFLQEEVTLEAQDSLEEAKSRTADLVAKLQAEKKARLEEKRKEKPVFLEAEDG
jgi:hypothetical protein